MENIRIKLIRLFTTYEQPVDVILIESLAALFYSHQGDLEEKIDALHTRLDEYRREVSSLQTTNAELFDTLLEVSTKYTEAILLATQQHEAEQRFKEREAREKKIIGDK